MYIAIYKSQPMSQLLCHRRPQTALPRAVIQKVIKLVNPMVWLGSSKEFIIHTLDKLCMATQWITAPRGDRRLLFKESHIKICISQGDILCKLNFTCMVFAFS